MDIAVGYVKKFSLEIEKGHSRQWSELYAGSFEDHDHAFSLAYRTIDEENPLLALEELRIHCHALNNDELYARHFIGRMETGKL